MKILLTNNHLHTFGGTENWTYTVYNELIDMGMEVDVFTLQADSNSIASQRFSNLKVTLKYGDSYDLILCNHNSCLHHIHRNSIKGKIKFISHGTVPALEQAVQGADEYIAISEEVQTHMLRSGFKSEVVLNPIDLDRFYPTKPLKVSPEALFSLCQGQKAIDQINLHFPALEVRSIPKSDEQTRQGRVSLNKDHYNEADVCVGLGRSAMESLACGRPALIYDWRHYQGELCDGLVTEKNVSTLLSKNLSGRVFGNSEISLRNYSSDTDSYRAIAEKYFDSKKIVKQLIR